MAMKISRDLDTFCPIRRKHGTRFVLRFRVFSSLIKSCLSLLHHSVTQHPCEYACCSQPEGISMRCWGSVTSMPKYFEAHFQAQEHAHLPLCWTVGHYEVQNCVYGTQLSCMAGNTCDHSRVSFGFANVNNRKELVLLTWQQLGIIQAVIVCC